MYKHFGIKSDERSVEFVHLDENTVKEVYEPMLSLALTEKYLKEELHHAVDSQVWSTEDTGGHLLKRAFFEQKHSFLTNYLPFLEDYKQWFEEMAKNDRAFTYQDHVSGHRKHNEVVEINEHLHLVLDTPTMAAMIKSTDMWLTSMKAA